ncbi:uncharacterized protein V6R79_002801 [Siganus canaliculatus]
MVQMCPGLRSVLVLLAVCLPCTALAGTEDVLEVKSRTDEDCSLTCTAQSKPGVQYRAVRWYKVAQPPAPRLSGLVTRDLPGGVELQYAGVSRQVALQGASYDLLLTNVTCADAGVYSCHLAAPVGQQNQDGEVLLTVTGCPEPAPENLTLDALMVAIATAVLMLALCIFLVSYMCLKNIIREKVRTAAKETLLDATSAPLDKKDLMLIYTLGPNTKTCSMKHICV